MARKDHHRAGISALKSIKKFAYYTAAFSVGMVLLGGTAQAAQEGCVPEDGSMEGDWAVCGKAYTGAEFFHLPGRGFLAFEELATQTLTLGAFEPSTTLGGITFGTEFEALKITGVGEEYTTGILFHKGLNYTTATRDQHIGTIDPGTGFGLGIPGPLGGPSGVFLANNPQNIVRDARYQVDLSWGSTFTNIESRHEADDHAYGYFAGVQYSWLDLDETFSGSIPGYTSGFSYDSRISTKSYGLHVGARGRRDLFQVVAGWQPQVSARAKVGLTYIDATLNDSIAYSGLISGVVADSSIRVSENKVAPYGSVGGAFSFNDKSSGAQIFFDAEYSLRPWFGSAIRTGTNSTGYKSEAAHVVTLSTGFRLRF